LNREEVFRLIQNKSWISLIEKFKDNEINDDIQSDHIAKTIIEKHFIDELISGNSFSNDIAYTEYLSQFYILQKSTKFNFKLSESNFEKLIERLVDENYNKGDLNRAYNYATEFIENKKCKKIIIEYQKEQSRIIEHSQESEISLKQNSNISKVDSTISLFKSQQEYTFYLAVREVFQSYMVFPNVSLNAIIKFDLIKNRLNTNEASYFFRRLVDCVVIDQEENYKPIKFIELDSHYHDEKSQKIRDKMKDKIIGLSGHKLYRVRSKNRVIEKEEFIKTIREVIGS
jgi:hypothetical protein